MDVSPSQLLDQAKERFALEDYYGCVHLLEELVGTGRAYADAHHLLALSYFLVGQAEKALGSVDSALKLNPQYLEALMHRGVILSALGRAQEADQAFEAARVAGSGDRGGMPAHHASQLANQHAALGEAYAAAGVPGEAIGQYQTALRLGPSFQDLRYRLAQLLLEAGRASEARGELETLVGARPQSVEGRAALGLACYLAGDVTAARDIWTALTQERPGDTRVKAYLSMLKRRTK